MLQLNEHSARFKKLKINIRSSMDYKTLKYILITKSAFSGQCSHQTFSPSTLRKAKLACQNAFKCFTEPTTSSDMQIISPDSNEEQS
jgi:hypothetical protein